MLPNDDAPKDGSVRKEWKRGSELIARQANNFGVVHPRNVIGPARDERQMTGVLAEDRALVEQPLHTAIDEPRKFRAGHRSVEPKVHSHDRRTFQTTRVRDEIDERRWHSALPQSSHPVPRDRAYHDLWPKRLLTRLDAQAVITVDENPCPRPRQHTSRMLFDEAYRRRRVELVEGHGWQPDGGILDARAKQLGDNADKWPGGGNIWRLVQRRNRERMPQPLSQASRLSVLRQPFGNRL